MNHYISWGVGVNSTAIIALHLLEELQGQPEIVFADTGGELPETLRYYDEVSDMLIPQGWTITTISPTTHPELYCQDAKEKSLFVYSWDLKFLPGAVKQRACSSRYKTRPLKRYAAGRKAMLGICRDELHRCRDGNLYPVASLSRAECKNAIKKAGLPPAHKTGCWFCAMQTKASWLSLYDQHPRLYNKALALEGHCDWIYFQKRSLEKQMAIWLDEREFDSRQLALW